VSKHRSVYSEGKVIITLAFNVFQSHARSRPGTRGSLTRAGDRVQSDSRRHSGRPSTSTVGERIHRGAILVRDARWCRESQTTHVQQPFVSLSLVIESVYFHPTDAGRAWALFRRRIISMSHPVVGGTPRLHPENHVLPIVSLDSVALNPLRLLRFSFTPREHPLEPRKTCVRSRSCRLALRAGRATSAALDGASGPRGVELVSREAGTGRVRARLQAEGPACRGQEK